MDAGLTELILAAVISGGVVSVILTFVLRFLFDRRLTTVSEEIKSQFEQQAVVYRSNREWRARLSVRTVTAFIRFSRTPARPPPFIPDTCATPAEAVMALLLSRVVLVCQQTGW